MFIKDCCDRRGYKHGAWWRCKFDISLCLALGKKNEMWANRYTYVKKWLYIKYIIVFRLIVINSIPGVFGNKKHK